MNSFSEYTNDVPSEEPDMEDTLSECTAESVDFRSTLMERFSTEDIEQMESEIEREIEAYMSAHILGMKQVTFHDDLVKTVAAHFYEQWVMGFGIMDDSESPEMVEWVREIADAYFEVGMIPRRETAEQKPMDHTDDMLPVNLAAKLARIRSVPAVEQRSAEWYAQRQQMLTASNAVKIFGTEAARNSLIYEKCQTVDSATMEPRYTATHQPLNDRLAMNWGVKYEPVTLAVYEWLYGEDILQVGCIPHSKYSFIGASPDGIVERNGRMIEVKNIYNREINGVPKDTYWIQMQWQMETCDLDECDFVESRFKEFATADEFYEKAANMRAGEEDEKIMGVMVFLIPRIRISEDGYIPPSVAAAQTSQYVTMPFDVSIDRDSIDAWLRDLCRIEYPHHVIHETYYWVLDEWSCVLVQRNRAWFAAAVPMVVDTWETIVRERESAEYEHRAPKKKVRSNSHDIVVHKEQGENHYIRNMPTLSNNVCLIKLESGEYPQREETAADIPRESGVRVMHLY